MSTAPIAPGLCTTLYDGSANLRAAWLGSRKLLTEAAVPIVKLHAYPTSELARTLDEVRKAMPAVRIHVATPGNVLVKNDGPEKGAKYARLCASWGIELFELNLEKSSSATGPGWTPDSGTKYSPEELDRRAKLLLDAIRPELGPTMKLGLTSHDKPKRFKLPWGALLGLSSPVSMHAPQEYASPPRSDDEPNGPPAPTSWRGAKARADASDADWLALATAGAIRADLAPGGKGFAVYGQVHDITTAGVMLLADRSDVACVWALDGRTGLADRTKRPKCDAAGAKAIRTLQRIRREVGEGAGSIARWQAAHGLEADGVAGSKTLQALGL